MLLATLEYYKEYRTYESIAASYGMAKQNICKIIHWVEEVLVRDTRFALPKRKILTENETMLEVILVDSTETPIQRPKKKQKNIIRAKKTTYNKNTSCRR